MTCREYIENYDYIKEHTSQINVLSTAQRINTQKFDLEKYNKVMSFMNENNKNEIVEALLEKVYGYIENKISPQLQELTESVNKLQKIPEYINEYFGEGEEVREKLGLISDMNEYLNTVLPVQVSRLVNDNMESFKSDISRNNTTSNGELSLDPDYNRTVGGVRNNEIDVVSLKAETNEAKLNVVIEYLLNEMPKLKEVSDYAIHNGERLKELSEYVSLNGLHLNDNLENIGETLESLKENANRNIDLEQYITHELPKVNALFEYIQYMRGRVNNMGCYVNNELSPKVFQNLEDIFSKISEQLGVENYSKIMRKEETDITEQVDQILAIATKKKEAETTRETLNFYVRQLDETKQKQFSFLTESQRQKFINQINNVQPTNINELNMIWSKVVDKNSLTEDKQNFIIANMPKIIKPLYEQLALSEQQRLLEISNNYVLDTPYKVQNFWTNRTEFKGMLEKQVRESYNPGLKSDDYINSLDENKQNIVRKMRALNS